MPVPFEQIEPLLLRVDKPARYLGGEFNQIVKEGPEVKVRACLAFPDVYDLGMSYHGYALLYERVNRNPAWAAERAFTPWPDFEALMRENEIPLYSLETKRALSEFDVVCFTLQHEVNYTNMLTMLDLGGIALESSDRSAPLPLILGGGEGAYSPEPMARFFDAFVAGDGEVALDEVLSTVEQAKAEDWTRDRLLMALIPIQGVYVPEFYDVEYLEDGRVKETRPNREGVPAVVKKAHFDVTLDEGTVKPVVPLLRTVHDRFAIEIRRGCVNGCRFCQAGMITRPVRERSVDQIIEIARQGIANTGYDEVSLLSLSSADYTAIGTLVRRMTREFGPNRVSISLPSLRINAFDVDIADEIRGIRKSGFTFAPEAGSDRLRRVINKEVDREEFLRIIEEVFERGWQTLKFYYMIGLPTETEEDLDGIVELTQAAAELGRKHQGRKALINVTLSPFVPKSNTPFQWEGQTPREEMERRYEYVRGRLRGRTISVKTNDVGSSFIEAALARGDRRMGATLLRAWQLGCKFDGWTECFDLNLWLKAFEETGLDPTFYANRQREQDEVFPFDHIDSSLGKRFLWADQRRAWRERVMEPCEVGKCAGCVACTDEIDHVLAMNQPGALEDSMERYAALGAGDAESKAARLDAGRRLEDEGEESALFGAAHRYAHRRDELAEESASEAGVGEKSRVFSRYRSQGSGGPIRRFAEPERVQRLRLTYTKQGPLRYLGHLDLAKVLGIVLRRAKTPLSYSEGYNAKPRIQHAPPLSLGIAGEAELLDAVLCERIEQRPLIEALNRCSVEGLRFTEVREIDLRADSVEASVEASRFSVELDGEAMGLDRERIVAQIEAFLAAEEFAVQVKKKRSIREIDLRRSILRIEVDTGGASEETSPNVTVVSLDISHAEGRFVKPHAALGFILGVPVELGPAARVTREKLLLHRSGKPRDGGVPTGPRR